MIRNIIFDFGGVVVTLSHPEALRRFKALGLPDADKWLDPYTQGGIFGELEEGKITAEEFRKELSILCGRELSYDECRHAWLGYREDVPERNLEALSADTAFEHQSLYDVVGEEWRFRWGRA